MSKNIEKVLQLEDPDTEAAVDFISRGVSVRLVITDDRLLIDVKATVGGPTSSEIEFNDFEVDLPAYDSSLDEEE